MKDGIYWVRINRRMRSKCKYALISPTRHKSLRFDNFLFLSHFCDPALQSAEHISLQLMRRILTLIFGIYFILFTP